MTVVSKTGGHAASGVERLTPTRLTWPARAGLLAVLVLFCAPLFIGLRDWDLRNDEAIYSYSVDRVLETGEWMTPRSSPGDGPFFEKPPLKVWLVAGGIKLGLLPFDERGMRFWDVLFASGAFVYVFLLGCRLAGPVAGVVSVFLLFTFDPLIFEHGVRGNNMEAPLLIAYSGGIYHFVRWADDGVSVVRRRLHALIIAVYFSLGFMTKFVAILFLPVVCAAAFMLVPRALTRARQTWKDWMIPAAFIVIACAPWFVYETVVNGRQFWDDIFLAHVIQRFSGTLAPDHIRPWHHYVTQLWRELQLARIGWVVLAGLGLLALRAWRRDWLARVCLVWCVLPLALLSMGTSKLFYYFYPFFPPLALGGGLVAATIVDLIDGPLVRTLVVRAAAVVRTRGVSPGLRTRRVLAGLGVVALFLGVWTFCFGSVTLEVAGVRLFRNSSTARALGIGSVAWLASGYGQWTMKPVAAALIVLFLPVATYAPRVQRFSSLDHPLQSIRDCGLAVQASGASPATGVLHVSQDVHHAFNYYLRRLGPWVEADPAGPDELRRRLSVPGAQSPIIMSKESYRTLVEGGEADVPAGITIGDTFFILLPGPYERCVPAVVAGGAGELRSRRAGAPIATPARIRGN
jgi:4-amino-4-deoxy-L-arabinose transferase-like glycosyltransferase